MSTSSLPGSLLSTSSLPGSLPGGDVLHGLREPPGWLPFRTSIRLPGGDVLHGLREAARQLRADSVRCSAAASSGYPASSMPAADPTAVLMARCLRITGATPW